MTVYFVDFMFAAAASVFVASKIIKLFVDISVFSSAALPCLRDLSQFFVNSYLLPVFLTYVKQVDFDVTQPFYSHPIIICNQ